MKLSLQHLLPDVFSSRRNIQSDIWLQDISFEEGNIYLIEAESGAGKSSLCSFLTGYRQDYHGSLYIDGKDARSFSPKEWTLLRQRTISLLFQELRLFPELTAWENVQIKNQLTHHKTDAQIRTWFQRLGIEDKMQTRLQFLSFGQQQRVALMRALSQPFKFLLADEPISHLDAINSQILADIILEEAHEQGAAVVITSIGKHPELPYDKILKI